MRGNRFRWFVAEGKEHPYLEKLEELPEEDKEDMLIAGVDSTEKERIGSFILEDNTVAHANAFQEGLEVMGTADALEKYDWLHDYYWNLVEIDTDKYTAKAGLEGEGGYFIRALPGVKAVYPIQACMFIAQEDLLQSAHNIIIAEEGAELPDKGTTGLVKVQVAYRDQEIYAKKNAKLSLQWCTTGVKKLLCGQYIGC